MKKSKIGKLNGVTDRDGNNHMPVWEMYQYLNNQVANLGWVCMTPWICLTIVGDGGMVLSALIETVPPP
eukprot:11042611-Prorocentrum_lima.AAC.1